ncbi:hypothetical protein BGX26_012429 [Mortierella sp. AD094]|nr:hypothetical protein BGX26_012429 [Mortierella sp. AD094]
MSKPVVILHHYQGSPYAEKVIAALRVKGIPWYSVPTSPMMPRPLLEPLTHGYRRIPVMQIGNNIYCDTALILDELERRYPEENISLPSYPGGGTAISDMIATWVDKQLFNNVKDQMPWGATPEEQKLSPLHAVFGNKEFLADRSQLSGGRPINTEAIKQAQPLLLDQLISNLDTLEHALRGPMQALQNRFPRPEGGWILGAVLPSAADFSAYAIVWWLISTKRAPNHVTPDAYPCIFEWYSQMNDCIKKHKHPTQDRVKISGEEALQVARQASKNLPNLGFVATNEGVHHQEKRKVGEFVAITPNDYGKVPVKGQILEITGRRVTIRPEPLESHQDINVFIHFPRSGYMIVPARKASL